MRRLCRANHFERFYLPAYSERSWGRSRKNLRRLCRDPDSHAPRKFLFGELTVCARGFLRNDPWGIVWVWPSGARKNCLSPTIEVVVALSDSVFHGNHQPRRSTRHLTKGLAVDHSEHLNNFSVFLASLKPRARTSESN